MKAWKKGAVIGMILILAIYILYSRPSYSAEIPDTPSKCKKGGGNWVEDSCYAEQANKQQLLWSFKTGGDVSKVTLSSDGSYVAVGSGDGRIYFFTNGGRLLWFYETGNVLNSVSISADGYYIAAG